MVWLCFFLHQSRDNLVVPKPALPCMVTPAPGDYGHVVKIQIQFLDCPGPISSGARGCPSAHHPAGQLNRSSTGWSWVTDRRQDCQTALDHTSLSPDQTLQMTPHFEVTWNCLYRNYHQRHGDWHGGGGGTRILA